MCYKMDMKNGVKQNARIKKTRQKILDAGSRLLFTDGWKEVTHLRLAAETGVSRGTIYRHWPNTDDLILEIFENCDPSPYQAKRVGELRTDLIAELRLLQANLQNSKLGDIILNAAQYANENIKYRKIHQNLHRIIKGPFIEIVCQHNFGKNCDDIGRKLIAPILYAQLIENKCLGSEVAEIVDEFIMKHKAAP